MTSFSTEMLLGLLEEDESGNLADLPELEDASAALPWGELLARSEVSVSEDGEGECGSDLMTMFSSVIITSLSAGGA